MSINSTTKKVCIELAPKAVDPLLSFEERTDLGIGEVADTSPSDHSVSVVFLQITHRAGLANRPNDFNPL